jgi:hypothetical protein
MSNEVVGTWRRGFGDSHGRAIDRHGPGTGDAGTDWAKPSRFLPSAEPTAPTALGEGPVPAKWGRGER